MTNSGQGRQNYVLENQVKLRNIAVSQRQNTVMGESFDKRTDSGYSERLGPQPESPQQQSKRPTELERRMYNPDSSLSSNYSVKHTVCQGEAQCDYTSVNRGSLDLRSGHSFNIPNNRGELQTDQNMHSEAQTSSSQSIPPDFSTIEQIPESSFRISQRLPPSGVSIVSDPESYEHNRANVQGTQSNERVTLSVVSTTSQLNNRSPCASQTALKFTSGSGLPSHKLDYGSQSLSLDSAECHSYNLDITTNPKMPYIDKRVDPDPPKEGFCKLRSPYEEYGSPDSTTRAFSSGCSCFKGTIAEKVKDIPQEGLDVLAMYLEPEGVGLKNWRHIASKNGVINQHIEHLKQHKSPFKEMLRLRQFNTYTIEKFQNDLNSYGCLDALYYLIDYLKNFENSCNCR